MLSFRLRTKRARERSCGFVLVALLGYRGLGLGTSVWAQKPTPCQPPLDFRQADRFWRGPYPDSLLQWAGDQVQVEWGDRQSTYPNKAAYAVLRNFTNKHPLAQYRTLHTGCEPGSSRAYLLGEYRDRKGQVFKIRVFWEIQNNQWKIFRIILR
ncbi:MAG: DUF4783 domain-containing protein [Bacteroidota bacterium]